MSENTAIIRELFVSDVTRDIPPVVYFHEQSPEKLAAEVSEYIITGGWPKGHPNHERVPNGIHEQYVRLLENIAAEIDNPSGADLPTAWVSGFYGSGKSSFAKLLGLSLDGVALPDGGSLAEAWLKRDTSPKAEELRKAWSALRQKLDPIAVVFDVGSAAQDAQHVHSVALRQVQLRLGYCSTSAWVADYELRLEREGEWKRFEALAEETLGRPWRDAKDGSFADDDFSLLMSKMFPDRFVDPMSWLDARAGTHTRSESPDEAIKAIREMIRFRKPGATLFLVVDEVSQFVLGHPDRVDRLRAFASALGASSGDRAKVWLLALGQQKLDEEADGSFLDWAKARFPPKFRVHLAPTNIRDVVHKRLLQKTQAGEKLLHALFETHRPTLKLHAYGCEEVSPDAFVETYPLLPGQIDLLLQLTSALRMRSTRAQGDDQAIRGLLQLLGELFREQRLADLPVGTLISLDKIYEVQQTALDSDVQASMARILAACTDEKDALLLRAAKAVALLELIQDTVPTDAKLVSQCLYDRVDLGNRLPQVTEALEELRRRNLLSYSEKSGYKVQSSAGEEWERERRDLPAPREAISVVVQEALKTMVSDPSRPSLQGRSFPWAARFSDGRRADDVPLLDPRDPAAVMVDFRFLAKDERGETAWIKRSDEANLRDRLVWVAGHGDTLEELARELLRSQAMVARHKPRRESLTGPRKLLLQQEENRIEDLQLSLRKAVEETWLQGRLYFRGNPLDLQHLGQGFGTILHAAAQQILPTLFPHFLATQVDPSELHQLLEETLPFGPSPKFVSGELGLLDLDGGRYVATCDGVVPKRILEQIEDAQGMSGTALLAHFGAPPYGYTASVVKACVAGLLRASRLRVHLDSGAEITAVRDAGVRELFDRDRSFRSATFLPAGEDDIGVATRNRICRLFEERLKIRMEREDDAIADAVARHFPEQAQLLREVYQRLNQLPGSPRGPAKLGELERAIEQCVRSCRQTRPTVLLVKKHFEVLQEGLLLLHAYHAELTPEVVQAVRATDDLLRFQLAQLEELELLSEGLAEAKERIETHLSGERPWQEISLLDDDLALVRAAYAEARSSLLGWQEEQVEDARGVIRRREGFSTLTADQAHEVLRPLNAAATDTSAEAVAPPLAALRDPFVVALRRAEDQAGLRLDELRSKHTNALYTKVDLEIRNREIRNEADVEALVEEIRKRLLEQLRSGSRVRLL